MPSTAPLVTTGILYLDYAAIGLFGLILLVNLFWSFSDSVVGHNKPATVTRYAVFIAFLAHLACLIDAYDSGFIFTRPVDSVVVYWPRYIISLLIFPAAIVSYFSILYRLKKHEKPEDSSNKKHFRMSKISNGDHILCLVKWLVGVLSLISSSFGVAVVLCGFYEIRLFAYIMYCITGLLTFALIFYYVSNFGLIAKSKHGFIKGMKTFFPKFGSRVTNLSFVGWVLLLLSWITSVVILGLGHAMTHVLTYENEVVSYIVIHVVVLAGLFFISGAASLAQHKEDLEKTQD